MSQLNLTSTTWWTTISIFVAFAFGSSRVRGPMQKRLARRHNSFTWRNITTKIGKKYTCYTCSSSKFSRPHTNRPMEIVIIIEKKPNDTTYNQFFLQNFGPYGPFPVGVPWVSIWGQFFKMLNVLSCISNFSVQSKDHKNI